MNLAPCGAAGLAAIGDFRAPEILYSRIYALYVKNGTAMRFFDVWRNLNRAN
jgi:hypothetical protein